MAGDISLPVSMERSITGVTPVVSYTEERIQASSAFFTSKSHCPFSMASAITDTAWYPIMVPVSFEASSHLGSIPCSSYLRSSERMKA